LFDLYPERRGNLFSDEVYRLVKASDATSVYTPVDLEDRASTVPYMPPNSKFSNNDVVLLTLQPQGSGDWFDPNALPISTTATSMEARVIATGPTYVDIAMAGGAFEAAFGPAPNNYGPSGPGDTKMRLRADRFFSDVPYTRMVAALSMITAVPDRNKDSWEELQGVDNSDEKGNGRSKICMDELLKETIISSHAFTDPSSALFHDLDAFDLQSINKLVSKPPMPNSVKLANQALAYIQKNPHNIFNPMNGPQLAAIGAALTRKLTMIQGPPGSGKTSTAGAIGFGFTHQSRSISPSAKVLACAFSNVGADNLAETFLKLGLKVVRVGKASAVAEHLWDYTLDAAINADPEAQKALENAARATAQLAKLQKRRKAIKNSNSNSNVLSDKTVQEMATAAVKKSIQACKKAAAKALRSADIIVSTSTGAADPHLMAACGLNADMDDLLEEDGRLGSKKGDSTSKGIQTAKLTAQPERTDAPDGLPPLSLPFVIVDEACQSVEPATLIPVTASNSCRALVLLGDPCQLPATVKSDPNSILTVSLMERLAATMPAPMVNTKTDITKMDSNYLDDLPMKQARSLMRSYRDDQNQLVYRKRFAGSLLLSVQYRMHPSIAAFSSALFYDGMLRTPEFLGAQRPFPKLLNDLMPCGNPDVGVRLINVGGRCNERRGEANKFTRTVYSNTASSPLEESTTYSNEAEAVRVVALIKEIMKKSDPENPLSPKSIGVVTPYSGQVQLIKNMIAADKEILAMASNPPATIEVKSVDGYQGRERDVIIFSAVRSNRRGNLGFLTDWRRLNVALTRARQALLVIGDAETLAEGDKHWAAFNKWCQGVRCIIDDTEYADEDCDSL
jgi:AAA domain